jgi:hypothetical protein
VPHRKSIVFIVKTIGRRAAFPTFEPITPVMLSENKASSGYSLLNYTQRCYHIVGSGFHLWNAENNQINVYKD